MPLVYFDTPYTMRGRLTQQQLNNEYFFKMLEEINYFFVRNNETFEWKQKQIEKLASMVGYPVKLTWWQNFLANVLMM